MNKVLYSVILILATTFASFGQKDKKAQQILDQMSSKYKAMEAFKASFDYTIENPQSGINDTFKGEITVKGPMYRLKMDGQEIINNGTTVWTYLKEENEVNISDYTPIEDEVSPSTIYTVYQKGYKHAYVEEKNEGGQIYDIIELIPEDKSKQIFKIRIKISRKDKAIKSWKMFEKSGSRYTCTIIDTTEELTIPDSYFGFDTSKYKGVEVVDLR